MESQEKAKFFVIGGPNGVGKTTFIETTFGENYEKILPDKIQEKLNLSNSFELAEIVSNLLNKAIKEQKNIVFEHNLHTSGIFEKMLDTEKKGYETNLIYMNVSSTNTLIRRVEDRYDSGTGHYVDASTIQERKSKGLANLKGNLSIPTNTIIVDNSERHPKAVLEFKKGV